MSRYFSRPQTTGKSHSCPHASPCGDGYDPLLPSLTVDDHVAVDTGLVDHRGDPIMRAPNAIGFGR